MNRVARVAALSVVVLLLFIIARDVDPGVALAALTSAQPAWLGAALLFNGGLLLPWAGLWFVLVPRAEQVSFRRLLECASYSAFLINATPFAGGRITSAALLSRHAGVGTATAVSVTALEMLAEGIAKLCILALALLMSPVPSGVRLAGLGITLAIAAGFAVLIALSTLRARLRGPLARIALALEALREPRRIGLALACIGAVKLFEIAAILCVQRAFGIDLPLATLPLVLAATMLATIFPITPGNFGVYEGAAFLVYQQLGVTPELAGALAIAQHVALLGAFAIMAFVLLLLTSVNASDGHDRTVSRLTAALVWLVLLSYAVCVGVLAVSRGLTTARAWRGMVRRRTAVTSVLPESG